MHAVGLNQLRAQPRVGHQDPDFDDMERWMSIQWSTYTEIGREW